MSRTQDGRPAAAFTRTLSEEQWRERLTEAEYHVLRQSGTERPFTGEYWDTWEAGTYLCRACGAELFTAETKFDARCGWPSFYEPAQEGDVTYVRDSSLGMERIEVRCGSCDSHLGHVFEGEGFAVPTDRRYCINSVSLSFRPAGQEEDDGGEDGTAAGTPGDGASDDGTGPRR